MVYNPRGSSETINFSANNITINGTSYGTSKAYSLADIAANGFRINSAQSMTGYISYGATTGLAQLAQNNQPDPFSQTTARWSNFEFTYTGGNAGGADLTNITQYGGSLRMDFLNGATSQSFVQNKLNTGDTFRQLAATSSNTSVSVISNSGEFVRVIGANKWPGSVMGSTVQNPYASFEPYLQSLTNTYGSNSSSTLTNLATGASPGGAGSYGYTSLANGTNTRVTANATYNLDYHFGSVTTNGTGGNGSSLVLSGYVNATPSAGGNTTVYSGLQISVAGDSASRNATTQLSMTNFLYLQSTANPSVVTSNSGWENLIADFGQANTEAGIQLKVAGDFSQGILDGFVGSTVIPNGGNSTIGNLSSADWFNQSIVGPDYTGSVAQPTNQYYSQWGNVVNSNSDGYNGGNFTRGGVYGNPYDDRFHLNTIAPNGSTTGMKITLLADGNLNVVPEPSTTLLLLLGGLGIFWMIRKHRAASKP